MTTLKVITFILAAKQFKFTIKVLLREIMLYAFPRMPHKYKNIEILKYAYENGFVQENLRLAISYANEVAVQYWIEKGAKLHDNSLYSRAVQVGGGLLKLALKTDRNFTYYFACNIIQSFEHIDVFLAAFNKIEIHRLVCQYISRGDRRMFEYLCDKCDKLIMFECSLATRNLLYCTRLINAGVNINECSSEYFWDAIMAFEFSLADFMLKHKFAPKPIELNLMAKCPKKIHIILKYCYEHELPLKIENNNWPKTKKIFSHIFSNKNVKLFCYFMSALTPFNPDELNEQYKKFSSSR